MFFNLKMKTGVILKWFWRIKNMNIELRKFEVTDIAKIRYFYTECTEWKNWDGPWEDWSYDEQYELNKRLEKTNHTPCFEYEIIFEGEHIGWVAAYYMTDDFKYNRLNKTDKIAIGIVIPDTTHRGLGIGKKVYKKYLDYFKSLGYTEIYTQTWSGNIPMVNLALSSGFKEINRYKDLRIVNNKTYDALTFKIEL